MLRHKNVKNKPWSKSFRYLKNKVVEHLANDAKDLDIFSHTFRSRDKSLEPNFNLQTKADQCAQDVIFDSFVLGDFMTIGKTQSETRQLNYLLDGIALFPALIIFNTVGLGAEIDSFGALFNNDTGVTVAMVFASIGFLLRPMIVSEVHMNYYRKQLSEAGKFNFLAMIVLLPVLTAIMILAFAMKEAKIEIPFMNML